MGADFIVESTVVPSGAGDLRAAVRRPRSDRLVPGLVFVDGSGCGGIEEWGGWPEWISECGAAALVHDKPGCGKSPGDWRTQSFADRAGEALAAVEVLRGWRGVDRHRIGLIGWSQGGWVSLLAARTSPEAIDRVVTISGPGVSMAEQERMRIDSWLRRDGVDGEDHAEGMAWVDEQARRLRSGEPADQVVDARRQYADRPWYAVVTQATPTPATAEFFARSMDVDPAELLPALTCPVLALFGGDDDSVPVFTSVARIAAALPDVGRDRHGIAVFPGADHGLFTGDPRPGIARRDQLAAGFLPMLTAFLEQ
ncbi:alpha/beta hydrolase family protein [Umezawaea beigongshangensis]|uniref:alpha/beta hydrolase family protein n=1 Tax=Umezawaea beigongshangensis TaxID=2780383 RepID=UPI0018F13B87|nr:alpha/beta hydrolase [Umezawaea beigongshangensis]